MTSKQESASGVWVPTEVAVTAALVSLKRVEQGREKAAEKYLQEWIQKNSRKKGWFFKAYTPSREHALSVLEGDVPWTGDLLSSSHMERFFYRERKHCWYEEQETLCKRILAVSKLDPLGKIYLTLSDYDLVF